MATGTANREGEMEAEEMTALAESRVNARFAGVSPTDFDRECSILDELHFLQRLHANAASAALTGMLAHPTRYKPRPGAPENWHEAIAEEAVQLADALLAKLGAAQ